MTAQRSLRSVVMFPLVATDLCAVQSICFLMRSNIIRVFIALQVTVELHNNPRKSLIAAVNVYGSFVLCEFELLI